VRSDGNFVEPYAPGMLDVAVFGRYIPHGQGQGLLQLGSAQYDVYAVDEAGNLSDAVPLPIPACAPIQAAPTKNAADASVDNTTADEPNAADDGGCSTGNGPNGSSAYGLLASLITLSIHRTRRRRPNEIRT
jgi:hypothetical protein